MAYFNSETIDTIEGIVSDMNMNLNALDDLSTKMFSGNTEVNADLQNAFKISTKAFYKNSLGDACSKLETDINDQVTIIENIVKDHPNW